MARRASKHKREPAMDVPVEFNTFRSEFDQLDADQQRAFADAFTSGDVGLQEIQSAVQEQALGSFQLSYLGSVPVAAARLTPTMLDMFGKQVIGTAAPRLKQLKRKPETVHVVVSSTGVRTVNNQTTEVLSEDQWSKVIFASADAKDKKRFGYLAFYSKLGLIYCHVYSAKEPICAAVVDRIMHFVRSKPTDPVVEQDRHQKATGATLGIYEMHALAIAVPAQDGEMPAAMLAGLEESMADMKKKKQKPADSDAIVMVVSSEGIRALAAAKLICSIVDAVSREVSRSIFITNIKYVNEIFVRKDNYFGVLYTGKQRQGLMYGIFYSPQKEAAKVCDTIKQAFAVAKEDVAARQGNPFMPMGSITEQVQGPLAAVQIPRGQLTAIRPLGAGQFGEVYLARQTLDDGTEALRAIKMLRGVASAEDRKEFLHEAELMASLKSDMLNGLAGVCAAQPPWLMVLEFCQDGDLLSHLESMRTRRRTMLLSEQLRAGADLAKGLQYLASQRLVHLDVAARNCLLHHNGLKLADFGTTRRYDEGKRYHRLRVAMKLSIRWLAPEAMGPPPKLLGEWSDVWAWGVVMHELFSYGRRPYRRLPIKAVPQAVLNGERLAKDDACPDDVYDLMSRCWIRKVRERPSFANIVEELDAIQGTLQETPRSYARMLDDAAGSSELSVADLAIQQQSLLEDYVIPEGLS